MNLTWVSAALVLAALALPVSIAVSNMALAGLTAALLARARRDGRRMLSAWRAEPVLVALAAYAAVGLTAAALSAAPGPALRDAVKDLHRLWSLGLFTAALALEPKAPLLPAFAISFGAMAILGCGQVLAAIAGEQLVVRAHGTIHPVVYGELMALAALGGLCFAARPDPREAAPSPLAGSLTLLFVAALFLSQTRIALLATPVAFVFLALLEPRAKRWIKMVLLVVAAALILWEFLPYGGRALSALLHYDSRSPQQARWTLWRVAWRIFLDNPVFGAGPGGYGRLFTQYARVTFDGESVWGSAHNLFLHQLAERGLAGGAALLTLIWCLAKRGFRATLISSTPRALWAAVAIPAFCVFSLTETSFQNEQFATLLLLIWAWGTREMRE